MKGIILYKSKYGTAKRYANWLQDALHFDIVETSKADIQKVKEYDIIIHCGGIYASGIAGLSFLRKHIKKLKDKKIAVLCAGASPYDEDAFEKIRKRNMRGGLMKFPLFYVRGSWDESKLTLIHHTMCKMLKKSLAKKDPSTFEPWMEALISLDGTSDWTDPIYLEPLISYIKEG